MIKSLHNKTVLSNVALGIAGVAIVSTMVVRSSSAAFTGQTGNAGNTWDAGTVTLTDNDAGSAKFSVANLRPTDAGNACIEVTYTGSLTPAASVKLYAAVTDSDGAGTDTGAAAQLSDDLDVTVSIYGATETCATVTPTKSTVFTTAALGTMPASYATGVNSTWTPTGGANETRAFEIAYVLGSDTANDAQGDGTAADFTWEATS